MNNNVSNQVQRGRLFAVKITAGQEKTVATFINIRLQTPENKNKPVYSVLVLDALKGYVFVEAANAHSGGECVYGFKHVKNQIPGVIQFSDVEKFLIPKSILSELDLDDIVEVVSGPFKGMRAKITRVEKEKSELTIVLLEAPYTLPISIDVNSLKLVEKNSASKNVESSDSESEENKWVVFKYLIESLNCIIS